VTGRGSFTPEVFVSNEQDDVPLDVELWQRYAVGVLHEIGVKGSGELSLMFVDNEAMSELNQRFMGKDGPTDVLSFPIAETEVDSGRSPDFGGTGPNVGAPESSKLPYLLGDVVIAPVVASGQSLEHAGDRGHRGTFEDEVALLIVHGILHVRGMDHEVEAEAVIMEAREDEILAKLRALLPDASAATEGSQTE
jgi:probable rRNA maturation factor